MFGSGVKTGMTATVALLRPILLVPLVGRAVCTVVAVGTILPGSVDLRFVTATLLAAVTTLLGFVWFSPSNDFLSLFYPPVIKSIGIEFLIKYNFLWLIILISEKNRIFA